MSRPAFKPVRQRTIDCPTCGAERLHPCVRVTGGLREVLDHGETVSPHAARLRLEASLKAALKAATT